MGTSSSNRIHNVQLMARLHRRHVIKPGDTFSFNDRVGPRTRRARLPRGPDDHRLAAPALDRRRRLPDRDDALQQRVRARAPDRRAPQPQLLHLALPDGPRRDGLLGRPRLRLQERPEDRDPDQDALHRLDAHVQLLRHRSAAGASSRRPASGRTGARRRRPTRSTRTRRAAPCARSSGSNESGFDVTVTRKVYEHGKLLRQDAFDEQLHRRRPDRRSTAPAARSPGRTSCCPRV